MQVRGGYASMICHALNGLTGGVDNVGGTQKANKEYTASFPKPMISWMTSPKRAKSTAKSTIAAAWSFPA